MIYCKPTLRLAKDEFSILHWLKTSDMMHIFMMLVVSMLFQDQNYLLC